MLERRKKNGWGIFQLWLNWLSGSGAVSLLIILSLWVRPLYLPIIAIVLQLLLFRTIRLNRESHIPSCYLLPFVVTRVLFWSAIVMFIINILYSNSVLDLVFDRSQVNKEIPFICVLIVAPISSLISGWAWLIRRKLSFCRDCKMRNGTPAERGFLGIIYTQIGHYQLGLMFWLSFISTVVSWTYYFMLYVNTSINVPDRFIFFILPILIWLLSAIYLGLRYLGIWGYYRQNVEGSIERHGAYTRIRYIMICDDKIALAEPETEPDRIIEPDKKYDTPVTTIISKTDNLDIITASEYFRNLSGLINVDVRFMYSNKLGNVDCNIYHYLCYLTEEQKLQFNQSHPNCRWYGILDIGKMINSKKTNPMFSSEIIRLHTMVLAWKTYDTNGMRKYKIRHYRPTFRVAEIKNLNVDFNNTHWLYIADNNQDTPFFKLRRFWRRHVNGIDQ